MSTIFRRLFDLLMKFRPIWTEEAGEQALISKDHIAAWLRGLPATFACHSSVFLPPHLVTLAGPRSAPAVLAVSDRFFRLVPGLRDQGGLIGFEVQKS